MAEPAILNPSAARAAFTRGVEPFLKGPHEVPPVTEWKVAMASFPTLRILVAVAGVPRFILRLDCSNFDYDPPSLSYEYPDGSAIPWTTVREMVALYPGVVRGTSTLINDVVLFPNGNGFVCRPGNLSYHEAHPEVNWREVRNQSAGRLDFIIDSAIRLLDPEKVARLGRQT